MPRFSDSGVMDAIPGIVLFFIFLYLLAVAARFLVAMTFGQRDYALFKEYRTNTDQKYNWWIFLNHWLGARDYKYKRYREEIVGESILKTNLKRFLFALIWAVTLVLFLIIAGVLYVSIVTE